MNGSPSARTEVEYSLRGPLSAPVACGEIPSVLGGGESHEYRSGDSLESRASTPTAFIDPDLQAALAEQHRDCRACHPERPVDWLRFVTLLTVASGSLALWIFATAWCVGRYS